MNASLSLSTEFQPPLEFQLGRFSLEALSPKHNERDFDALTSSKADLRAIIDPNDFWPDEVLSLEDNLRDLTKDFQEFLDWSTFRYAILSSDKSSYDGCLYIRPTDAAGYDCRIEFWFKPTCQTLEREFQERVQEWLSEYWGFRTMALPGREMSWEDYRNLLRAAAGWNLNFTFFRLIPGAGKLEHRQRLESRVLGKKALTWEDVLNREYEPWIGCLVFDTSGETPAQSQKRFEKEVLSEYSA